MENIPRSFNVEDSLILFKFYSQHSLLDKLNKISIPALKDVLEKSAGSAICSKQNQVVVEIL